MEKNIKSEGKTIFEIRESLTRIYNLFDITISGIETHLKNDSPDTDAVTDALQFILYQIEDLINETALKDAGTPTTVIPASNTHTEQ